MPQTKTIDQRLREAIQKDGRKLAVIAKAAKSSYMALWSWYTERQVKYDFVQAEKVYYELTGRMFVHQEDVPHTRPVMDLEFLTASFALDETVPSGVRWKKRGPEHFKNNSFAAMANTKRAGEMAGCIIRKSDYPRWRILTTRGGIFAHQVIWVLNYGPIPKGLMIDHADGNGLNNDLRNLRLATRSQNRFNSKTRKDSKTGFKGVTKRGNRWTAKTTSASGQRIFLGYFDTPEAAFKAYVDASKHHHGEFHNAGTHKSQEADTGRQAKYDFVQAEKVHRALTGKGFGE